MSAVTFHTDTKTELVKVEAADEFVLQAARVSTDGDIRERAEAVSDKSELLGLIRFLMKNRHGTPFEHNMFTFFVKAPIFVFREHHRHRIGWSYNEMSGRYMELLPEFYVPGPGRNMKRVEGTKTGAYRYEPDEDLRREFTADLKTTNIHAWNTYQSALDRGVVPEVARMALQVNVFSQMWATCNARSIMAFLSLRTERPKGYIVPSWLDGKGEDGLGFFEIPVDKNGNGPLDSGTWSLTPSKPQYEIQLVANAMEHLFSKVMPMTYNAWNEFGRV